MPASLSSTELLVFPLFLLLGVVALLRELWAERTWRPSPLALSIFCIVVVGNLEQGAIMLGGGSQVSSKTAGGITTTAIVAPAAMKSLSKLAWLMAAVCCVALVLVELARSRQVNMAALAVFLAATMSNFSAMATGTYVYSMRWNFMTAIFLSLVFMKPSLSALRGAAVGLAMLALWSLAMPLVNPAAATNSCGGSKCGIFNDLYHGATFNENALGLTCALGLPVVWYGLRSARWAFVAIEVLLLLASGSRTSMITAAAGLIFIPLAAHWRATWRISLARFSAILLLILVAVGICLPFLGLPDAKFTGRARLWRIAIHTMGTDPGRWLFGSGPESWSHLFDLGIIDSASSYSAHNQYMTVIFLSGIVGLVLLLAALFVGFTRNVGNIAPYAGVLVPALVAAFTERPWSLERPDWMIWDLCLLVCLATPAVSRPMVGSTARAAVTVPTLERNV